MNNLNFTALAILAGYFLFILVVGLLASRRKEETAEAYFLAGRKLPWYAVGMSMVGSNISTEHFIGMVGAAYIFGMAPANWEWMSLASLSLLLFIFIPYYFRAKIYTLPQFLEQRYDSTTRIIFAALSTIHLVLVLLAGALYAGGLIIHNYLQPGQPVMLDDGGISPYFIGGILLVALVTGIYSIKGGLKAVVWTDVVQVVILVVGGTMVSWLALRTAGGWSEMWEINREADAGRTHLLHSADHPFAPWTGVFTLWLSLGIWYACTNQFYIQRAFGARSEWDCRMGIILTGMMKAAIPLLVVFPGMMAFAIYGADLPRDQVFSTLVQDLLPNWMGAIVLAAMAAAIMSTVSSVLNSASTIFTIDFYQRFFRPDAPQARMVRVGQYATAGFLLLGMAWAPFIVVFEKGLFIYIQDMAAFFAPPIGVIFVVGMLWRGATPKGATVTLVAGMLFGIGLRVLSAYADGAIAAAVAPFLNRAFFSFVFSLILIVGVSFFTAPSTAEKRLVTWDKSFMRLPEADRKEYGGIKDFRIWWGVWAAVVVGLFIIFR